MPRPWDPDDRGEAEEAAPPDAMREMGRKYLADIRGVHADRQAEQEAAKAEAEAQAEAEWDPVMEVQSAFQEATWEDRREEIKAARLTDTKDGLVVALEMLQIRMRYNLRAAEIEWCFDETELPQEWGPSGWHPTSDRIEAAVRDKIEESFLFTTDKPARWSNTAWVNSRDALSVWCSIDPFLEWAAALEWDGESRLDNWLTDLFEMVPGQDEELLSWCSRQPLIGACKRAELPGAKMDQMVILCGPQGAGKSTALRELLPPENQEQWFSDTFDFLVDGKERIESTLGVVIVEIGEMVGATRQETARIKQDMARTIDRVRLAYRKNPDVIPRRHVRIGTTNHQGDLPNDPTGLRRFVPVDLQAIRVGNVRDIAEYLDHHREQLWAEAWARRHEAIHTDSDKLTKAASAAAESHRYADEILEEIAHEFISELKSTTFTLSEFSGFVSRRYEKDQSVNKHQGALKKALLNAGAEYKVVAVEGVRKRCYVVPDKTSKLPSSGQQADSSEQPESTEAF